MSAWRPHEYVPPVRAGITNRDAACTTCGRPRPHEYHNLSGELNIPTTLEELRRDLLDVRAGFPAGTRAYFALTVAHGSLRPNAEESHT